MYTLQYIHPWVSLLMDCCWHSWIAATLTYTIQAFEGISCTSTWLAQVEQTSITMRDLSYSSCGACFMFIELHSYVNVSSIVQGHNMVMWAQQRSYCMAWEARLSITSLYAKPAVKSFSLTHSRTWLNPRTDWKADLWTDWLSFIEKFYFTNVDLLLPTYKW